MAHYILRKLAYGLLVTVLVVTGITAVIFLTPVDPARLTFGQRSDLATSKAKTAELGLDQPLHIQLGMYLRDLSPVDVLPGNPEQLRKYRFVCLCAFTDGSMLVLKTPYLRESYQSGRPVSEILADTIPVTSLLAISALLFAIFLGVIAGVLAALKQNTWVDHGISAFSVLGYSLPSYVVAMMLALLAGYWLSAWTGLDVQGSLYVLDDFGDWHLRWENLILPTVALGLRPVALIAQLTRGTMLETLSQDYVRTARSKGLPEWRVVGYHTLRNALNPLVSAISGWFASLLTGAFFVESIFNFKGLGDTTVTALLNFDVPVVLGCVLFTSTAFILINLLTDLTYAWLDPRVSVK